MELTGVIQRLQEYYKTPYHGVTRAHLCTTVDHYAASYGDKGWGCGYRNFQMLLSSLVTEENYCKILFNGELIVISLFLTSRLVHPCHLDESVPSFRSSWGMFSFLLYFAQEFL